MSPSTTRPTPNAPSGSAGPPAAVESLNRLSAPARPRRIPPSARPHRPGSPTGSAPAAPRPAGITTSSRSTTPLVPDYRIIILGAGRNPRGGLPTAIHPIDQRSCVLDWLLEAFSVLPGSDIRFVGGFMAHAVQDRYPEVQVIHNESWETTGPTYSLGLASLSCERAVFVSYADVVFRPQIVQRMDCIEADVVIAIDRTWRTRYDGRSRADLDNAEKVRLAGADLLDIGKHVATDHADAEFAGLMRIAAATARRLQNVMHSGTFQPGDGLPEVIRFLLNNDVAVSVVDVNGEWAELNAPQDLARFVLGTKAESLQRLRPLMRRGVISPQVSFTQGEWADAPQPIIARIRSAFPQDRVIVRSSARSEDTWHASAAGAYTSVLDVPVDEPDRLHQAISEVIHSYGEPRPDNQVLVQPMLRDVTLSGVVMTRTPSLGAPYYVINYDDTTARTDSVTAGDTGTLRTLRLHRDADPGDNLPTEIHQLLAAIRETERLVGHDALDIEFAVTADGRVHILQVRPIAVAHADQPMDDQRIAAALREAQTFFVQLARPRPFLVGATTSLSVMSDWNPAEIIGTKPGRLALSLYRLLVTDETWATQRAEYGYRDVRPCNLLVDVLGHPYIDVRATFNSFVPAGLPDELADRLVNHYLDKLARNPELHDKVEFDILFTCMTFDFAERARELYAGGFSPSDVEKLRSALLCLTRHGIARTPFDLAGLDASQQRFERIIAAGLPPLERAYLLLEDIRRQGVLTFAHLARSGFVAVSLLRSLSRAGILPETVRSDFLASLRTISSRMQDDARAVHAGTLSWADFVERYGHLRPGTYDITSPHYASNPDEYLRPAVAAAMQDHVPATDFRWPEPVADALRAALHEIGLGVDLASFEKFLRQAIEGREFSKFVFTRNLSAALEALAEFGNAHFVSRDELAQIRIQDLFALRGAPTENLSRTLKRLARHGRDAADITQAVCLPGQVFSADDLVCFEQLKTAPNFVTRKQIRAKVIGLTAKTSPDTPIEGGIVLTPNADPGFDWIFARKIAGLLTMYGGTNSHMAIRAAEFELPAAIGIGEVLYQKLSQAAMIELDCAAGQIRVVR